MILKNTKYTIVIALCVCFLSGCSITDYISPTPSSSTTSEDGSNEFNPLDPKVANSESSEETSPSPTPVQVVESTPSDTPSTSIPTYEEGSEVTSTLSADEFISSTEDLNQFETYFQILASYIYEPCTNTELVSDQIIDPAIFMCAKNSEDVHDENGVITLNEQDVLTWAEHLFGKSIDFDLLNAECEYDFYIDYNDDNHTVTAHAFTDKVAVRGYGVNLDDLNFQADGHNLYVVAPVLKIEDRGIWEPYQTLRYEFILNSDENGKPYYLLQNVVLCP